MSQALAIVPNELPTIAMPALPTLDEVETLNKMCKIAAYSGFLNSDSNNPTHRAADAFFVMMYGRELGIPAMTSLKTIYVIDGKPTCSGQALLSLVRRAGVEVQLPDPGRVTDAATVRIKRPDGEWREFTYTESMAKDANLTGKSNWKKHRREMLVWRAVSTAIRFEASDFAGGLYTVEEIRPDIDVDAEGAPLDLRFLQSAPPDAVEDAEFSEPQTDDEKPPSEPGEPVPWPENPNIQAEIRKLIGDHGLDAQAIIRQLNPPDSETWERFTDAARAGMSWDDVRDRIQVIAEEQNAPARPKKGNPGSGKPLSEADLDRLKADIWQALATPPDALFEQLDRPVTAFTSLEAARKAVRTVLIKEGIGPLYCDSVLYYRNGTGNTRWGFFEIPGLALSVKRFGLRTFLTEGCGEDWAERNGVAAWEPTVEGRVYHIDTVQVSWQRDDRGLLLATAVEPFVEADLDATTEGDES